MAERKVVSKVEMTVFDSAVEKVVYLAEMKVVRTDKKMAAC